MTKTSNMVVVGVAVLVGIGCGRSSGPDVGAPRERSAAGAAPSAKAPLRTVTGAGYAVPFTLEQHRDFPGTTQILIGTVREVLPARHVANGMVEYVYSPVVLEVAMVVRGTKPASGTVILRAFGGVADGVEFKTEIEPAPEVLVKGTRLLVLGPDPIVVEGDEPVEALTANGIFVIGADAAVDATLVQHGDGAARARIPLAAAERALGVSLRE